MMLEEVRAIISPPNVFPSGQKKPEKSTPQPASNNNTGSAALWAVLSVMKPSTQSSRLFEGQKIWYANTVPQFDKLYKTVPIGLSLRYLQQFWLCIREQKPEKTGTDSLMLETRPHLTQCDLVQTNPDVIRGFMVQRRCAVINCRKLLYHAVVVKRNKWRHEEQSVCVTEVWWNAWQT